MAFSLASIKLKPEAVITSTVDLSCFISVSAAALNSASCLLAASTLAFSVIAPSLSSTTWSKFLILSRFSLRPLPNTKCAAIAATAAPVVDDPAITAVLNFFEFASALASALAILI